MASAWLQKSAIQNLRRLRLGFSIRCMARGGPGASEATLLRPSNSVTLSDEEQIFVASQWQLMWWRFRRHKLAMASLVILILFYIPVITPGFFATSDPNAAYGIRTLVPPQGINLFSGWRFHPHVFAISGKRDPETFQMVYRRDVSRTVPVHFFGRGYEYKFLGLIHTDRHLLTVEAGNGSNEYLAILGTDVQGRDVWSRLMYGTQTSMSIGIVGVGLSLLLGIILGGLSGYYGGPIDVLIQRIIEIIRSIPDIPLWMGLAAALPANWSIMRIYFMITVILALFQWTELARVVRGRFLAMREEDFVVAAELMGASRSRIILRHMLPSFYSHVIAVVTLAFPLMIIAETALSFLGVGLRPPAISWGVLLQEAQNVQSVALSPWLLIPALPVIIAVLAFNFLGDGIRDAADPYSS